MTQCASRCGRPPSPRFFPLCEHCKTCLVDAPPLCSECGGLHPKIEKCNRPWMNWPRNLGIFKIWASYLWVGEGYNVFKAWKMRPGRQFDGQILKLSEPMAKMIKNENIQAWISVPGFGLHVRHHYSSPLPSCRIGAHLSHQTGTPLFEGVLIKTRQLFYSKQALLNLEGRLQNPLDFYCSQKQLLRLSSIDRLGIVDDVFTSGRTFQRAAMALRNVGFRGRIYLYALGIRPAIPGGQNPRGLLEQPTRSPVFKH